MNSGYGTHSNVASTGGVQSLCCAELYIVGGVLEHPEDGARRFCAAAREIETRASMRTWGVATIILDPEAAAHPPHFSQASLNDNTTEWRSQVELNGVDDDEVADQELEDQCVRAVAMVLLQRMKLLRLWGSLVSIPTLESKTRIQVNILVQQSLFCVYYGKSGI